MNAKTSSVEILMNVVSWFPWKKKTRTARSLWRKKTSQKCLFCNVALRRWTLYKNESQITRNAGSIINFQGASLTSDKVTHMWIIVSIDILLTVSLEEIAHSKFICKTNFIPVSIYLSKSTMETPEQCVKSVKVNNKDTRTTWLMLLWCLCS